MHDRQKSGSCTSEGFLWTRKDVCALLDRICCGVTLGEQNRYDSGDFNPAGHDVVMSKTGWKIGRVALIDETGERRVGR